MLDGLNAGGQGTPERRFFRRETVMKSLGKDTRLQGFSRPEIVVEWTRAIQDLVLSDDLKFHDRKLQPGPALNCLVLHFLSQDEATRAEWMRSGLAKLEAALQDDADTGKKAGPAGTGPKRLSVESETVRSKPVRRKKGG